MRHIDMRSAWLKLLKDRQLIEFGSIKGTENPADFFTKIYSRKEFKAAHAKLMGKLPKFLCRSREPANVTADGKSTDKETPLVDIEDLTLTEHGTVRKSSICP